MSRLTKTAAIIAWLIFATLAYAFVWSRNLDFFPQLPNAVGHWVTYLTGMQNSDDAEALTLYYMLIVSFVAASVLTSLAMLLWTVFRHRIDKVSR